MRERLLIRTVGVLASIAMGCACEATPVPDAGVTSDAGALVDATGTDTRDPEDASPPNDASSALDARAARDSGAVTCAAGESYEVYVEAATEVGCRQLHECIAARTTRVAASSCRSDASATSSYLEAIAAGRLRFDGAAACACLASYRPGCDFDFAAAIPCLDVLRPADPEGRCTTAYDCGFGSRCVLTDERCPGHCASFGAREGEPCGAMETCFLGLRCGPAGTCLPATRLGDPCTSTFDCIYAGLGAWCDAPSPGMPGVCRAGRGIGEPCGFMGSASFPQCASPLTCVGGRCGSGGTAGEVCSPTAPCATTAWCNAGICAQARAPGESCSADDECPVSFACAGTCVPLPLVGEPCLDGRCWGECVSGVCTARASGAACDPSAPFAPQCDGRCDPASMTCAALRAEGESCTVPIECAEGLTCLGSMCRAACAL
jgi:hypothetical protein